MVFHFFSIDEKKRNKEKSRQNNASPRQLSLTPLFCPPNAPDIRDFILKQFMIKKLENMVKIN